MNNYMQILSKVLLTLTSVLVISMPAYAVINDSIVDSNINHDIVDSKNLSPDDNYYIGIKTGMITVDENNAQSIDNPLSYGAYLGYQFNQEFGVEIDYRVSQKTNVTKNNGDHSVYDMTTYGTYLTYHYPLENIPLTNKPFYVKAKLGVGGVEVDERHLTNHKSTDDIGVAGGLGLGIYLYKNIALETEFNMLKVDNINISDVTLSANLHF